MRLSKAFLVLLMTGVTIAQAQTADEIITQYAENTGGAENWKALDGVKMKANIKQGGFEMPMEIVRLKDGRQYTKVDFQGQSFMQAVYDGAVVWSTNFQTMKAEKADAEQTAIIAQEAKSFPDPFLTYKENDFKVEYIGKETVEGTETFKLKLTKKPLTIDGEEVENVEYHYFDTENYVPIVVESEVKMGPAKGTVSQTLLSDYQEVEGLYFPHSITQRVKGNPAAGQPVTITSIELNPEVSDEIFQFPAE